MIPAISNPETADTQRGQVLVMFVLLLTVLILFVALVIDVGFFIHERQRVQAAADAAALAGAQELPDDANLAQQTALDYVAANGIDASNVEITFACTSPEGVCDEAAGVYDTNFVTPTSKAPAFLGGILSVVGAGGSCWVSGCDVSATAGACRGACGAVGNGPAEIVVILDHSGSMSTSDLAESKDAILSMFESLNHDFQQVSVALTPPVTPGDYCDSIDDWGDPMVAARAPYRHLPDIARRAQLPEPAGRCYRLCGPHGRRRGAPRRAHQPGRPAAGRDERTRR